jgi:hypothetical protein
MRKLLNDNKGNIGTIIMAVATAITIAVSILIVYSIMAGMGSQTALNTQVSRNIGWGFAPNNSRPVSNATESLISGLGTFFTLSPIYIVVLVAVAIIGAVMGIMVINKR